MPLNHAVPRVACGSHRLLSWVPRPGIGVVVLLAASTPAIAPVARAHAQTVAIGLKAGMARASVWDTAAAMVTTDVAGGAMLAVRFGPHFALQTEVYRLRRHLSGEYGSLGPWTMDQTYLQVPLLAELRMPLQGRAVVPVAYIGPWVSFLTSCAYWDRFNGRSCPEQGVEDGGAWGLAWGGGAEIAAGPADVILDLRGEAAYPKVTPPRYAGLGAQYQGSTEVFLGLAFPLGGRRAGPGQAAVSARRSRAAAGAREPLTPGDRVRVRMIDASLFGTVVARTPDSLIVATEDPRFPGRLTLTPGMVEMVEVSLGRQSSAMPTLLGAAIGAAALGLYVVAQQGTRSDARPELAVTLPYAIAAPVVGAIVGRSAGRERWREADFPPRAQASR